MNSTTHVELRPGAYADSVTLLQVSRAVQDVDGVATAQVAMATPLNLEVLEQMGFSLPDSTPNDMVVAIRLADETALDAALAAVDTALTRTTSRDTGGATREPHRTTGAALREAGPDALVLVSVPGASATVEAMDALDAGHDVMLFSDNVPVEQEVALKTAAAGRGLLVMGPDCGTAVVDGLGLGFANATRPGPVGIVAASGTGCQQLLALLDHAGVGVSNALGVGGRDLSSAVGGRSTREALRRLDADPDVELVVLVSKPPADDVAASIREFAAALDTPVELALLGPGQPDLTAAAERVLARLGSAVPEWPVSGVAAPAARGDVLQGLFVGGTLRDEAALIAGGEHPMVDFGADELTQGRAHPMIDPTIRLDHLSRVADDPRTGVVLLDVVLGHGAEPDPAAALAPVIRDVVAKGVPVVVCCVGTTGDPQGLDAQRSALADAGAEVHLSNARATRRALDLLGART
jgi:FdrA protein